MEARLFKILDQVNTWLKFAEAKNGALLAADSAIIFALLRSFTDLCALPYWPRIYVFGGMVLLFLAGILALISFVPRTRLPWLLATRQPSIHDNLVFYGDIAAYDAKSYVASMYQRDGKTEAEPSSIEIDLASQVIINSRICLSKYRLFAVGAWISLAALITPVPVLVLLLFARSKKGESNDPRGSASAEV